MCVRVRIRQGDRLYHSLSLHVTSEDGPGSSARDNGGTVVASPAEGPQLGELGPEGGS